MIGVEISPPTPPIDVTVNVLPFSSSRRARPALPSVPRRSTSAAMANRSFWSASRITGTMSPPGVATATPM